MATNTISSTTVNTCYSSLSIKTLTIQHKQMNITFNFSSLLTSLFTLILVFDAAFSTLTCNTSFQNYNYIHNTTNHQNTEFRICLKRSNLQQSAYSNDKAIHPLEYQLHQEGDH